MADASYLQPLSSEDFAGNPVDIALELGVSQMTISRAINNQPLGTPGWSRQFALERRS
jgi:hypothetical protein